MICGGHKLLLLLGLWSCSWEKQSNRQQSVLWKMKVIQVIIYFFFLDFSFRYILHWSFVSKCKQNCQLLSSLSTVVVISVHHDYKVNSWTVTQNTLLESIIGATSVWVQTFQMVFHSAASRSYDIHLFVFSKWRISFPRTDIIDNWYNLIIRNRIFSTHTTITN